MSVGSICACPIPTSTPIPLAGSPRHQLHTLWHCDLQLVVTPALQGTFLRGTLSRSLAEGVASLWHGRSGTKAKKEEAAAAVGAGAGGSLGAMGGAMLGGWVHWNIRLVWKSTGLCRKASHLNELQ